jgi:hypothetical protein
MIQMNINKLAEEVTFTVPLESEVRTMGLLRPISATTENIDITDLVDYFITGMTSSKLSYIIKSFPVNDYEVGKEVIIRGTDIRAVVTHDSSERIDYTMYLGSDIEIYYSDVAGGTVYRFRPPRQTGYSDSTVFMLEYLTLIDEPILDTNLFINRGVNNVFESIKRLKTVANIQELQKTGFGFYKLYNKGLI